MSAFGAAACADAGSRLRPLRLGHRRSGGRLYGLVPVSPHARLPVGQIAARGPIRRESCRFLVGTVLGVPERAAGDGVEDVGPLRLDGDADRVAGRIIAPGRK